MTRGLLRDRRGSAGAEMALIAPFLVMLMIGSSELGHYFYRQHELVKAVRDGAVFASRQPIEMFDCASNTVNANVVDQAKAVTMLGVTTATSDDVDKWTADALTFSVGLTCVTSANGTTLGGIYTSNAGLVPVITVTASMPYNPLIGNFGVPAGLKLQATEQASVVGI